MTIEPEKQNSKVIACEAISRHADFRHLSTIKDIKVELRYATTNNFVGHDLYSPLDCSWLHRDAASALESSVGWLAANHPDLRFLVLDAMRPQRVQEQLWEKLQGTNLLEYLANPVRGSIHSFGMAVDITLVNLQGKELDMGTPFDDLTEKSHPALEEQLLARHVLSATQITNRQILRQAMRYSGWQGINSEWWHFDCGDRNIVRNQYARIL